MQVVEKVQVQNLYLISNTTYDDGKRHHQCSDVMGSSRPPIYKTKNKTKKDFRLPLAIKAQTNHLISYILIYGVPYAFLFLMVINILTIVDYYTRYVWGYLMRNKSEKET